MNKNYMYDYELFKQGKHYIRLETTEDWYTVSDELSELGINWISGKPLATEINRWRKNKGNFLIRYDGTSLKYGSYDTSFYEGKIKLLLRKKVEKGETKMTNKGMNMKELYDEIENVYFNKDKRTTVIKFKDGSTVKATASENTEFCEYAGFTAALMKSKYGKLENITKLIERKKIMNKYQEALNVLVNQPENFVYSSGQMIQTRNRKETKILQELVDKEKPMKPYYQDMTSSLGGVDDVSRTTIQELTCRQCDYAYLNDYINDYEYCAYCGQKLDWSDLE